MQVPPDRCEEITLRCSLQMVLPVDLDKILDCLVPHFPYLYNGDNNCTCLMDGRAGEMTGYVTHSGYNLWCSLTVCSSIHRGNLHGPFKKPGRNPGFKKKKKKN